MNLMTMAPKAKLIALTQGLIFQVLINGIAFVCGILIVRNLEKQEYALYLVATSFGAMLVIIAESGAGIALISSVNKFKLKLRGEIFALPNLVIPQVKWIIVFAIAFSLGLALLSLHRIGTSAPYQLAIAAFVLAFGLISSYSGLLDSAMRALHMQRLSQKIRLVENTLRLALVGLLMWLNAFRLDAILLATFFGIVVSLLWQIRIKAAPQAPANDAEIAGTMRRSILKQFPNSLFFSLQGTMIPAVFSYFGRVELLAEFGALSRFLMPFTIIGAVCSMYVMPWFSSSQRWQRDFWLYLIFMLGLSAILPLCAFIAPDLMLSLLGKNYLQLGSQLQWALVLGSLGFTTGMAWSLLAHRGHVDYNWVSIPLTIVFQAIVIFSTGLRTLNDAILLNAVGMISTVVVVALEYARANKRPALASTEHAVAHNVHG